MNIEIAKEDELNEVLDLQYLAYQTKAALFGTNDIPSLKQTLEEVREGYKQAAFHLINQVLLYYN